MKTTKILIDTNGTANWGKNPNPLLRFVQWDNSQLLCELSEHRITELNSLLNDKQFRKVVDGNLGMFSVNAKNLEMFIERCNELQNKFA